MAYETRSLDALGAAVRGMVRQYLKGTDATLRQNFTAVTAKVLALLAREYEFRLAWIYAQLFTRTTTDRAALRMQGADFGIYQKAASAASGAITGTGQPAITYPAGIRFLSAGLTYLTTAAFTAAPDGTFTAVVQSEAVGAASNREPEAVMTLADPSLYPTLSETAEVGADGLGGGADIEGIESLKARILERKARPPQGGSLSDYERFALEVSGVLKAWAFSFTGGIGSIAVFFLFDGRPNSIPTAADVDVVQTHIDSLRLIRVDDTVAVAPLPQALDVTISDLAMDTPEVRATIEANIAAMLLTRARPGLDADPFVLSRSWVSEAISSAAGEDSHTLVLPAGDVTYTGGHLPVPGIVTYA
ncbi:Mu-like prophage FluMu protein gp47 [Azorhizobium oxalatiphilum]|uniref:Mu-like prophage FluMu protein gp47 n=1 Tax=Azorhizobium oxalatiphilum TaxID=980631 RepID=A0A917BS87_9HYPH|nr:baseplate J/gp47 family protein [Azorhizobium oxalatiphilum]GGF56788.1 Mu-like prophage FluMu protein gp47 [Azorhizobium oxalatiphilum]